jgi:hypothetical protein
MLLCTNCNTPIEENECGTYTEMHGFDGGIGEEYPQCPHCKSTDVYGAMLCSGCDEYFCGEYVQVLNGDVYCERCFTIKDTDDI